MPIFQDSDISLLGVYCKTFPHVHRETDTECFSRIVFSSPKVKNKNKNNPPPKKKKNPQMSINSQMDKYIYNIILKTFSWM